MITNKHRFFTLGLIIFSSSFLALPAYARRDQIDNSERLQFLDQATGASNVSQSGSSSFEQRLNAVLDTTASSERTVVAAEDAAVREKALSDQNQKELDATRLSELNPERYDPLKNRDKTKIEDISVAESSKEDGTEKGFQNTRSEIQKEFDDRISKKTSKKSEALPGSGSGTENSSASNSLANNPFYAGDKAPGEANDFEARKPVIISRLLARGSSQEEAENAVRGASSQEDLILTLMNDQAFSYGEASEITS